MPAASDFGLVLRSELEYVYGHAPHPDAAQRLEKYLGTLAVLDEARRIAGEPSDNADPASIDPQQLRQAVLSNVDLRLSGLALSGGGIRSAAFGLGVIQALSRAGILSRFDYLSGVSGGGYILGWLLAWSYRLAGGLTSVQSLLADRSAIAEPAALNYLRRYVIYLAPRGRWFSADVWGLIAAYLRNLSVSLAFALPLLLLPVLLAHLVFFGVRGTVETHIGWWQHSGFLALLMLAAAEVVAMRLFAREVVPRDWVDGTRATQLLLAVHLGVGSTLAALFLLVQSPPSIVLDALKVTAAFLMFGFFALLGWRISARRIAAGQSDTDLSSVARLLLGAILAALTFVGLASVFHAWFAVPPGAPAITIVWRLPYVALAWSLLVVVPEFANQMVLSREINDSDREWTVRYSGVLLFGSMVWMLAVGMVLVVPAWLQTVAEPRDRAIVALVIAIVITAAAIKRWNIVLLGLAAWGLAFLTCMWAFTQVRPLAALDEVGSAVSSAAIGIIVLTAFILLIDRFVNINRFSLHAIYRNRLSRAFLGASRPVRDRADACQPEEAAQFKSRDPGAFQDFDADDNPRLRWLKQRADSPTMTGWLPLAIFNASLNSTWRITEAGRHAKAYPFEFSQMYCGSPETGYCRTEEYASEEGGISLATVMATSGAALSSRAGRRDSGPLAFLKTIFNLRLGWWLGNPSDARRRRAAAPRFSMFAFCAELFGASLRTSNWINLSDGGHFENLGVFALLQRGCATIVAIDADADPHRECFDLANLVRLARAELNVDIVLDSPWRIGTPDLGEHGRHCALFKVIYPGGLEGRLLYVKTALYEGGAISPVDVLSYFRHHPAFPHESTVNQFFSEAQFEAYRRLGEQTLQAIAGQDAKPAELDVLFAGARRHLNLSS